MAETASASVVASEVPAASADPGTNGATGAEAPAPTPAQVQKLKLVINGKEEERDIEWVKTRAQKSEAAERMFSEASKQRKEATEIQEQFKTDPWGAMRKLGMDPRQISEKFLAGELESEMLDPRERAMREREAKNTEIERQHKAREEEAQTAQQTEENSRYQKQYDEEFGAAFKAVDLPRDPHIIRRIAELHLQNLTDGYEIPILDLAKQVREERMGEQVLFLKSMEGKQLLDFLGPEIANKIRKADLAQLRSGTSLPPTPPGKTFTSDDEKPQRKTLTEKEFNALLDKRAGR